MRKSKKTVATTTTTPQAAPATDEQSFGRDWDLADLPRVAPGAAVKKAGSKLGRALRGNRT